jgi:AraC-like DNA-binding protein
MRRSNRRRWQAMDSNHRQLFEALAHSGVFQEYQSAFAEVARLPLTLRPVESWQLPFHGLANENPFCALLSRSSRACAMCLRMQQKLCHNAQQRAATLTCWHGLALTAVPVRVGGQLIGFLETGQAFREPPTVAQYRRCERQVASWGVPVRKSSLKRAYFQGRVLPRSAYEGLVGIISVFAEHLSMLGNQMAIQQENAEPLVIRRAREFIHERHSENLRLGQVARAINSSPFYFCKLFKKAIGLNFTAYVARVRVEKAKNLLLNPDVQVSEIAYAVGFQSLTHFNRVFKALVGQTPSLYRRQVVGLSVANGGGNGESPGNGAAGPQ